MAETSSDGLGVKFGGAMAAVVSVAGSDLLRPLGPVSAWFAALCFLALFLCISWKRLARYRTLCAILGFVFAGVAFAQSTTSPKTSVNAGIIANNVIVVAQVQAKVIPVSPSTRALLVLQAGLRSSNPAERAAAAEQALATSDPGARRDAIQIIFSNGNAMLREIALIEALGARKGTGLSFQPDSDSIKMDLGSMLTGATLQIYHVDKSSGAFQAQLRTSRSSPGIQGTVSVDGITMSSDTFNLAPPHSAPAVFTTLLVQLHPGNDFRLTGTARTASGQTVSLSLPLL